MLTYYLFRIASVIVPVFPVRLGHFLASLFADIAYLFQGRARRNVRSNLRRVLGVSVSESELSKMAREVFRHGAKNYYDLFRIPSLTMEDIERIIQVNGMDNLFKSLEDGKGVIFVAPHLGSFDMVAQIALVYSLKVTIPVEPIKPPKLFDLVTRARAAKGIRLVPVGGRASKEIHRALSDNEVVAIAADRDVMRNGIKVTFFGEETSVPYAPAVLAQRTGARVISGCGVRNADGTYAIHVEPELQLQFTGNPKADIKTNSQTITHAMENLIRKHPEQWVAFEPVWNN